jgi:murein DD-endopeptidase MepM/ murein hydrolase activator NlpD
MAGVVRFAGPVAGETWITVRHVDGLETTYGGVAATVRAGDRVALGQSLGRIRTGRRHLDWGARLHGAYIDPLGLLAGWRVRLVAPTNADDGRTVAAQG